jgi:hypothetical protein
VCPHKCVGRDARARPLVSRHAGWLSSLVLFCSPASLSSELCSSTVTCAMACSGRSLCRRRSCSPRNQGPTLRVSAGCTCGCAGRCARCAEKYDACRYVACPSLQVREGKQLNRFFLSQGRAATARADDWHQAFFGADDAAAVVRAKHGDWRRLLSSGGCITDRCEPLVAAARADGSVGAVVGGNVTALMGPL